MTREISFGKGDIERLERFIREFCEFGEDRAYILSAIARPKENEQISHGNAPMFREILTHEDDIPEKLRKLRTLANYYEPDEGGELQFRLYITANSRDIRSAFFNFQKELIDKEKRISEGHSPTKNKIKRLDKEWISEIQSDAHKDDSLFIIDIDDKELYESTLEKLKEKTDIRFTIETPNGYHILTEPFNYTEFNALDEYEEIELKKDSLLYLSYI